VGANGSQQSFTKRIEWARADIAEDNADTADCQTPEMFLAMTPVMPAMTMMIIFMMTVVTVRGIV
jgi:hypothetical protein